MLREGSGPGRVTLAPVVNGLDPVADGVDRVGLDGELVPVIELGFQRGPKRFLLRIVPGHPGPAHRQPQPVVAGGLVQLG
jgi:hypothetical protein